MTLSTMIGLTFLVVAAWSYAAPLGEAVAGVCTLLAGWYYEINSRTEDR